MEKWDFETLKNFFRHETMLDDKKCEKMAMFLAKDNTISLLLRAKPEDYKKFVE